MNTKLNNSHMMEVVNIAGKHGFNITLSDVRGAVESKYRRLWQEKCNCGSRIMHNDGGNYHQTLEIFVSDEHIVVFVSDTSETFCSFAIRI